MRSTPRSRRDRTSSRFTRTITWTLLFQIVALPAWSNPTDGQVVAGDATIHAPENNRLEITQHSKRAVIDWRSFSIEGGEHTHFNQPSSRSIVINRVVGDDVSQIFGALSGNGRVVVINRNGIHVGPEARIDVAGFVGTTANISNRDAMAGNLNFDWAGNPNGFILNEGIITAAEGGLIGLVAPWVENQGTLQATLGRVVLASGDTFTLDLYGDQLVEIALSDSLADRMRGVESNGAIMANGGEVILMTASTAGLAVDSVINVGGTISAMSIGEVEGRIVLRGSPDSSVNIAGTLDATGHGAGEVGGSVEVTGHDVALEGSAVVDVSGSMGGGTAHIGGDVQGDGALPNAQTLTVARGAEVRANAEDSGDAGEVVLWSDGRTDFSGMISAQAVRGGVGGFVEVSGKQHLAFSGDVSTGAGGTLLLDPLDLTVDEDLATSLRRSLIDGTSITLDATNSVTIAATIDGRVDEGGVAGGGILIETEEGPVNINADIITNGGAIDVRAGGDIIMASEGGNVAADGGVVLFVSNEQNETGSAPITLTAGGGADLQWIATGGGVTVQSVDDIHTRKRIDAGGSGVSLTSTAGSVLVDADIVARNSRIMVDANSAVTMGNGAGLFVSNGLEGLGDGLIQVVGNETLQLGTLATAGQVVVESIGHVFLDGRVDAGADGTTIESLGASVFVNSDVVTQDGSIQLTAEGLVIMADEGGGISDEIPEVALIVGDGQGGIGTASIEIEAGHDIELQHTATRGALSAIAGTGATARGALKIMQDMGTLEVAPSSIVLQGTSVELPENIVVDNGTVSITARSESITRAGDDTNWAILVSDGNADGEANRNAGGGLGDTNGDEMIDAEDAGGVKLSFTSGALDVQDISTLGSIEVTYLGDHESTTNGTDGIVNLNRQLGAADSRIGGLDIDAPTVNQKAEIVASGAVALGSKLGFGTTTLRRNIFTDGGTFDVRNDAIIDPRREFLDENGNQLTFIQLIGLDDDGAPLLRSEDGGEVLVTDVHQLADTYQMTLEELEAYVLENRRHDTQTDEWFVELFIDEFNSETSALGSLFPNLRQEVFANETQHGNFGHVVTSTWTLTIDTSDASGAGGAVTFHGDVGIPSDIMPFTQFTSFLSPFALAPFEDFASQLFFGLRDEFPNGPLGEEQPLVSTTSEGFTEFIEFSIDAGDQTVAFNGDIGAGTLGDRGIVTLNLNIIGAAKLELDPSSFVSLNSLRIPSDIIQINDALFVTGGLQSLEPTGPPEN
jgi:filamentous hemagglutinin family protein